MNMKELTEKVASFEGFVSKPYRDATGTLTIGYGFTSFSLVSRPSITKEEAKTYLEAILKSYRESVEKLSSEHALSFNENQILSLTDFCYNCGKLNLHKLFHLNGNINARIRTIEEIGNALPLYCTSKGVKLKGLETRRNWEKELFFSSVSTNVSRETFTTKDIQTLCNTIIRNNNLPFNELVVDGKIGEKSIEVIMHILRRCV